eukprot:TRINITY_DN33678_c5_g1_i1.p1 TRINITY_DN33678_c5_g1~~TRINITY_DN33678_c5_g1_i1.p1  ORF type:complete len:536 (+),score=144.50 TRINITY_DN33678_c5_g1_i1:115-1722(+)
MEACNIKVVARVRPILLHEKGAQTVLHTTDDKVIVDVKGAGEARFQQNFAFDRVFGEQTSNMAFFHESGVRDLLDKVLEGYNASIFAYGQTGSGKTFTMTGTEQQLEQRSGQNGQQFVTGIVHESMQYLVQKKMEDPSISLKISYVEVYNEQVVDLLDPSKGSLNVRYTKSRDFYVQDLLLIDCDSIEEIMEVLSEGARNRTVGSHKLNQDSSRSHALFEIRVKRGSTIGKLAFTDLAGSERTKITAPNGRSLKESSSINKSLFTLNQIITALSAPVRPPHIPYRDSQLTKLLADALGGSAQTLLIACCAPLESFAEESGNTLRFASKAMAVVNETLIQSNDPAVALAQLQFKLEKARTQAGGMRRKIQALESDNKRLEKELIQAKRSASKASMVRSKPNTASSQKDKSLMKEMASENNVLRERVLEWQQHCAALRMMIEQQQQQQQFQPQSIPMMAMQPMMGSNGMMSPISPSDELGGDGININMMNPPPGSIMMFPPATMNPMMVPQISNGYNNNNGTENITTDEIEDAMMGI